MSTADPVASALARLDRPAAPSGEFGEELRERLLVELRPAPVRPARRRTFRLALAGLALGLLLAAIATATYLLTRSTEGTPLGAVANGPLTVARNGGIAELRFDGRWHTIWHCQPLASCGIPTGFAWSPDGGRVVVAIPVWGRPNPAAGWQVGDTRTGTSHHIDAEVLGCHEQRDLAWSPDGRQIAYACPSRISVIRPDGSERIDLTWAPGGYSSPSWSPDGRRLVFAVRRGSGWLGTSALFIVNADGTGLRRLASGGTAPAWSPDGRRIAFRAGCGGIELITPGGRAVTPARARSSCRAIGTPGVPIWSPDGKEIAISTQAHRGIYLMKADGTGVRKISDFDARGGFGTARPAWRPIRGGSAHPPGTGCSAAGCS
jgi:hypothetical protein